MLINVSTASPPYRVSQARAAEELKRRMGTRPAVARMIDAAASHSGIAFRSVVLQDTEVDEPERFYPSTPDGPSPDTRVRMIKYKEWSQRLTAEAAGAVLASSSCLPSEVSRLVTVSCTGFSAPNFDHHLITTLGLPSNVQRTHVGFMGCAAVLVGFTSALEALESARERGGTVLLVSVELCSLHLQTEPTRDNILANMIFADGCGAALFSSSSKLKPRARLVATHSYLFPDSTAFMGWEIGNHGFEMLLSSELPAIITQQAVPMARETLKKAGLNVTDVRHWALHPGARAIIDALQTGLELTDEQAEPSRTVLREHGNMSSASILYVLQELFSFRKLHAGDWICAIAFGPGLTMELVLFQSA